MIYHGNKSLPSPGKEAARAVGYDDIPRHKFYQGYHIVIASRECGDIKYLLNNGVSPKQIIACDMDPKALSAARKLGVVIAGHPRIASSISLTTLWMYRMH